MTQTSNATEKKKDKLSGGGLIRKESSVLRNFHRIKRKKVQNQEVVGDEILQADFAFVDTYDDPETSKIIDTDVDDDYDSMYGNVYHDTSLAAACSQFFRGTGCIGLLIMTALTCAIVIPIMKSRKDPHIANADQSQLPPTTQPSSVEYAPILEKILEVSDEDTMMLDEDSPQYLAFNWIANEDPLRMKHTDSALIQRYVLVLLYFATDGPNAWSKHKSGKWLSGNNVCEWNHVICDAFDLETHQGIATGLKLDNMGLLGTLPAELGILDALDFLVLSNNNLHGPIPPELYKLVRLKTLELNKNQLTGVISDDIGELRDLTGLSLGENNLQGTIPESIGQCTKMTHLSLHTNKLGGKIPVRASKLIHLEVLDLAKNSLTGTLPRDMMNFSKLKFLELSFNELTGFIPSEFGSIKNLKRLRMNLNKLTGTLPTQLGALQDLMFLNLESNLDINGPIPSELGNLSKLMALDLGQCSLTGSLPTDLGRMSSLEYLNVYNNKITGTLPTELGMLTNLRESRLQFTDLKGNVPNEICALRDERLLLLEADCTYDIRCNYPTCCTRCSD